MPLSRLESPAPAAKRKRKWSLSAFCVGPLPEEYTPEYRRRSSIVEIKPNVPDFETLPANTAPTKCIPYTRPARRRAVRFQDPLPCPRSLGSPHPAILARIAFFSDSHGLRKLRRVSREMRTVADRVLLRRVAIGRGGVRVFPPPGGCGGGSVWVDDEPLPVIRAKAEEPTLTLAATASAIMTSSTPEEPSHSLWAPEPPQGDSDDELSDAEDDSGSVSSAAGLAGTTSFAACVSAACAALTLPPASSITYILPARYANRILRGARVVDILPEADVAIMRRMLPSPPPIARAHPGASGTLTSPTVVVFSSARDDVPPTYPRPSITTSAARTVITHLLDADGTEALEGMCCGIEHTILLITPADENVKGDLDDEEAEVATLVGSLRATTLARTLSPATTLAPTLTPSPGANVQTLPRRSSLIEDDADPHRLLESLAAHIARLLPTSGSAWTIVGAETWPWGWIAGTSERKCSGREGEADMEAAMRALVEARFAHWANKASGKRLRFVTRDNWCKEVGGEVYEMATEL